MDTDGDGTPDGCDVCPENPDFTDEEGPCGCEECPEPCKICTPDHVMNDYEWIEKVSFNAYENESGANAEGYTDFGDTGVSLGLGDSLSIWVFPEYLEHLCESSIHIYADWNGDCDFDDQGELIVWHKTTEEAGADIAIPEYSIVGTVRFRIILHNGRIRGGCQKYIDGEVEDYSIEVFTREEIDQGPKSLSKKATSFGQVKIAPNPVRVNSRLHVQFNSENVTEMKLYNVDGSIVRTSVMRSGDNFINTNGLFPGVYLLEAKIDGKRVTKKVIIN